jgi:rubredoxin
MPICPHCNEEIDALAHGITACLVFQASLDENGKLNTGIDPGKPLNPFIFDSLTEWYSCPFCGGSIVDEAKVNDTIGNKVDQAAERFLKGVEDYLKEPGEKDEHSKSN